jgi:hypothetical protein
MAELDFIQDPKFGVLSLAEALINWPNKFGTLSTFTNPDGTPLWGESGIDQTTVMVDIHNRGQINIIPASARGSPAPKQTGDSRDIKPLPTFRHALGDYITADQFQNVRKLGTVDQLDVFEEKLYERLDDLNWKQWQTTEYLRWAALRGDVMQPGTTQPLYNTYDLMGETQQVVNFHISGTSGDPIQDATNAILDYAQLNAFGEPIQKYAVFCSPSFHDNLQKNTAFRDAFKYFSGMPNPNRELLRTPFEFKDMIYFRELGRASFMNADGTRTTTTFIPDGEAIAVPLGTRQVFRTYYAPADYIETVNTIGQRLYAKTKVMDMDRGIEVETVSQQLNVALKPRLVIRCTSD